MNSIQLKNKLFQILNMLFFVRFNILRSNFVKKDKNFKFECLGQGSVGTNYTKTKPEGKLLFYILILNLLNREKFSKFSWSPNK